MTESKLNPFDAELLVMIGDIAKSQPEVEENPDRYEITVDTTEIQGNAIEALKQAVAGRLGKHLLVTHTLDAAVVFNVEYDPTEYPEHKKPEAFDVPKEVRAMAEFFGKMFPGSKVEIHRVEMPKRNPRDKRRAKNQQKNRKGGRNNER